MAVATEVGDGATTLFWLDRWVHGKRIEDLAPRLFRLIPKRLANRRTVAEALTDSRWALDLHGQLSESVLQGSLLFGAYERIWKTWTPPKCAFFLWLVLHNRCWTADRLAKRNLPHPNLCLLCEQEQESINHLLVGCVFARQFWFILLQRVGLAALAPLPAVASFDEWWRQASDSVNGIA
jgi:hypothetical protein